MEKLASILLDLKWAELDEFAAHIRDVAIDDNGDQNDVRWVAGSLIDWAKEHHPEVQK
ncbi:hypothetical protein [Roseibium alexandrii]|uniref:Uncharacterized protein n=1 Tax=Roseibium alexandrii TaxID=388408 RepID=A0A0M7A0A5_9HYPH|nr:hypothetical protein [Roseibium alexandrii]CTQ67224.1 hypothetical protein LAX5112_01276 [Roseibium alexandrii]